MPRIVHLGLGNFHRAHQAWYTELANRKGRAAWRITGVSMRSRTVRDLLEPQGCAYTLAISDASGAQDLRISAIEQVLVAGEDSDKIIATTSDDDTKIVTLTVTEKGYGLRADGTLDLTAPDIVADISGANRTIYGLLARGLNARQTPITVLSCDNLTANGDTLKAALSAFCAAAGIAFPAEKVRFPNAMVDRITPATTDDLRAQVFARTGWRDAAPVATERFSDWVIEDHFANARPDWDAQFVPDVAPFELRKLRMLNGAHSYLAYAGILRGHDYVHEAMGDTVLRAGAQAVMAEAAETLPDVTKASAPGYGAALCARFDNPGLRHALRQIAMDGSQKLPIRMMATWRARRDAGLSSPALETGMRAWIDFVFGEAGAGRDLDDPLATRCAALAHAGDRAGLAGVLGADAVLAQKL
ncbi:MAG: mannitol dehydrogenase family protein [Sedimentitalea sp.]